MMLPTKALAVCLKVHEGQRRKDGQTPYATHPIRVAQRLQRLNVNPQMVEAALLHDTVEDQPERITLQVIERDFGTTVRNIVDEMTKKPGMTRKAYIDTFRTASPEACVVKLADRLDNLSDDFSWDEDYRFTYACEAERLIQNVFSNDRVRQRLPLPDPLRPRGDNWVVLKDLLPVATWLTSLRNDLESVISGAKA